MSTRDPDDLGRAIGARLRPLVYPLCLIGVASGPVIALLYWAAGAPAEFGAAAIIGYVLISVGAGILIYYLPNRPGPLAIAAYSVAYVAGLFTVMASGSGSDSTVPVASYLLPVGAYLVAAVLAVLQWLRTQAVKLTTERDRKSVV